MTHLDIVEPEICDHNSTACGSFLFNLFVL